MSQGPEVLVHLVALVRCKGIAITSVERNGSLAISPSELFSPC